MLQNLRPRERALFGHVPDDEEGDAPPLGDALELARTFAHLPDGAGRRGKFARVYRLNGVDYHEFFVRNRLLDVFEASFIQEQQIGGVEL